MPEQKLNQSAARALDILELVANMPTGIAPHRLSDILGMNKSTLHLLLKTLVSKGFLRKWGTGWYGIGPAAIGLRRTARDHDLLTKATPMMLRISTRMLATVFLAEWIGGAVVAILRAGPQHGGVLEIPGAGDLRPYGIGLIFHAFLDEKDGVAFKKRNPFNSWGRPLWRSRAEVNGVIRKARESGVLVIDKKENNGDFRVAAPIFGPDGRMIAALALHRPLQSTSKEHQQECIELVRKAAQELSLELRTPPRSVNADRSAQSGV